jgi:GTPase SAR1 family protein
MVHDGASFKISVVGDAGVGKTSLVMARFSEAVPILLGGHLLVRCRSE